MKFNNNNLKYFEEKEGLLFKYSPLQSVLKDLPEKGSFVLKKGINCNELFKYLSVSWNRTQE